MLGTKQNIARLQSDFYRDKYRQVLLRLLISSSLIVLLILIIVYLVLFRAPPKYYVTTTEGQIIPIKAAAPPH